MLPVLHFDPTVETTGTIGAVTVFRNQSLQLHQAGMPEQVRTDLALLERGKVDAIDASGQQPSQVSLAHHQRQPVQILAVAHREFFPELALSVSIGTSGDQARTSGEVAHGRAIRRQSSCRSGASPPPGLFRGASGGRFLADRATLSP